MVAQRRVAVAHRWRRNGIVAARMKWMARQKPPERQARSSPDSVHAQRLCRVFGAARIEPAHGRQPDGDTSLVEANQPDESPRHLGPAFELASNGPQGTRRAAISTPVTCFPLPNAGAPARHRPSCSAARAPGCASGTISVPVREQIATVPPPAAHRRLPYPRARPSACTAYRASTFRPLARRALMMRRPAGVLMRARKPCRRFRRRRLG